MLHELIEDGEFLALIPPGDHLVACQELAGDLEEIRIRVQRVGLAGIIRSQVDGAVTTTDGDLEVAKLPRAHGHLGVVQLVSAQEHFGRECGGPLRGQLGGIRRRLGALLIEVVRELELVAVVVGSAILEAIEVVEDERQVVPLVDVPVQLQQDLVCFPGAVAGLSARIVAVDVVGDIDDAVMVGLTEPGAFHAIT